MKATVIKHNDSSYQVTGLDELEKKNGVQLYEMRYLFSIGSKHYKTEKNAIKAIERNGFEYVPTTSEQLFCAYD